MDNICVFLFLCWLTLSTSQKITQLRVPDVVNIRTHDSAILDCDYDLSDKDGLVVKWFFEDNPIPVYQWIPGRSGPQALGILKGKLDLSYKASNHNLTMYRALKIKDLSLDLSGEYLCVVSTFLKEDSMKKRMIVLEPPETVKMYPIKEDEDSVTVVCTAQGSFPRPILNITYKGSPILENTETDTAKSDNGLYNVTTLVTLKDETLEYPTDFVCNLYIPDAHYSQEVKLQYYPDNAAGSRRPIFLLLAAFLTIVAYLS